ncbi:MAG: gliding motility-associated C-terminal domain-containing protein, partial [Bacteroidia bacterium]
HPQPKLVITNPDPICEPSNLDLTIPAVTKGSDLGLKYEYYSDLDATTLLQYPKVITSGGTFYIKAINPITGCTNVKPVLVVVNKLITPEFPVIDELCVNDNTPSLPKISINDIPGSWDPAIISSAKAGVTTYTFTPSSEVCARTISIQVRVNKPRNPVFNPIGPLCQNVPATGLPGWSNNGVTGTWNPSKISTDLAGTFSFKFTPFAGMCAKDTTIEIKVNPEVVTVFDPIGPLCPDSEAPLLPATDKNGIAGTWFPAVVSTTKPGEFDYVFTPDGVTCENLKPMKIRVTEPIVLTETHQDIGYSIEPKGSIDLSASGGLGTLTFQWDNGAKTEDLTALGKGTYTVTVNDQNNCTAKLSVTITRIELMTIAAIVNDACPGFAGSINFELTNVPDGKYDILYSAGKFANVPVLDGKATVPAAKGIYNNIRLFVNGNSTVNPLGGLLNVEVKALPAITLKAKAVRSECSNQMGSIEFIFTNIPQGVYDITYDGGQFTGVQVIGNLASVPAIAKTYANLTLKVNTCSTNSATVTLDQPIGITPEVAPPVQPTCAVPSGTIVVTNPSGPNYSYSKDGGNTWQDSETFAGLQPSAIYQLMTREKATGCESEILPVTLYSVPSDPDLATVSITSPTCDAPTGSFTITNIDFGAGYEYSTDGILYHDSKTFNGLAPNQVYQLHVRLKSTGCESLTPVTIDRIPPPLDAPLAEITKQPDCIDQTGSIWITDPRTNGYLYFLDGIGQFSKILTGIAPGEHLLTIKTRLSNCESANTILTVDPVPPIPAAPALIGTNPFVVCEESPMQTLDANTVIQIESGAVIAWYDKPTGGNLVAAPILNKIGDTTYYAEASRGNCISLTRTEVNLSIYQTPLVFGPASPIEQCASNPIQTLDAASYITGLKSGEILTWYDAAVGGNMVSPFLNTPSKKTIYAEASNMKCKAVSRVPVTLIINPSPAPPVWLSDLIECEQSPLQTLDARNGIAQPTPGTTLKWYEQAVGGTPVESPTLNTVNSKTWYAEASIGDCVNSNRTEVKLTISPVPAAPVWVKDLTECEKNPIQTLDARNGIAVSLPGTTIKWYEQAVGGTPVALPILNVMNTKTYFAEASIGDCINPNRTAVKLTINPAPAILVSQNPAAECATNPLQTIDAGKYVTTLPGITINWWDAATGGNPVANPILNTSGTQTFYAEGFNGLCASQARTAITLTIHSLPDAAEAMETVHPTCNNPDGTVLVTSPKEGTGFEYSIDGGTYQTSTTFARLKWGEHLVRVKQTATGCESAKATLVTISAIPPAPVLAVTAVVNCVCNGGAGTITFTVKNATDGNYTITYDSGKFENVSFSGGMAQVIVPAGNYNNLTIDANGCTSGEILMASVTQPAPIDIQESVREIDLKSQRKGSIELHVSGGSGNYTYLWSNGATTAAIQDLNEGAYTVTVTDKNGCPVTKLITIPVPNFSPVAIDDQFSVGCDVISGNLIANDYDPEGDPFYLDPVPVQNTLHGSLILNTDGTFEYHPDIRFSGFDYFSYAIYDAKHYLGDTAKVVLTIINDFDCDGIVDEIDPDADGDGILNVNEVLPGQDWRTTDTDGDGIPNYLDIDSDNDGIVDNVEAQLTSGYIPPSGKDTNGDGLDDAYDPANGGTRLIPVDTDKDGIPDFLDTDSDNDLVPDYIEGHDLNADGKADQIASGKDSDNDGLDDAYDTVNRYTTSGNVTGSNAVMQDFDGDGMPDWRDDNDDDDEFLTRFEDLNGDGDYSNDDTDHDGHPEYLDYGRDCNLFIPNIFTPNNDNIHDYFLIYCIDHYPNAKMFIFDQIGNKIFEKDHYGNLQYWGSVSRAWWNGRYGSDGNASSDLVPIGTYYYVLDLGNGEIKKSYVFVSY